ncbi:hypothetical protein ACH3XW_9370 [Acanthocheilonema viteae]
MYEGRCIEYLNRCGVRVVSNFLVIAHIHRAISRIDMIIAVTEWVGSLISEHLTEHKAFIGTHGTGSLPYFLLTSET